jgi:hypothetical protein
MAQAQDREAGGCHLAGVGRRSEDQARRAERGGTRHIGRAQEPVYTDEPAPEPPYELERADQQGEHAAEHMHAEGELMLEVGLPLLDEVDLRLERQVPRHDDGYVDAGQSHDHPARPGQPAGEPPLGLGRTGVVRWLLRSMVLMASSLGSPELRSTLVIKGRSACPSVG